MPDKLPWISVKDRLPAIGEDVLFWSTGDAHFKKWFPDSQGYVGYGSMYYSDGSTFLDKTNTDRDCDPNEDHHVTHWLEVTAP